MEKDFVKYQDLETHKVVTWDYPWAFFKPGDLVISTTGGQERLFEVTSSHYDRLLFVLYSKYIDWDGEQFGYRSSEVNIPCFEGTRDISSLHIFPLAYHHSQASVKKRLVARGMRFEALKGTSINLIAV